MIWIALRIFLALQTPPPESNSSDFLVDEVRQMAPRLDVATAKLHLEAAQMVGEPELFLAIAYIETRFDPTRVSEVRGRRFCGVAQTSAGSDRFTCLVMRDLVVGYAASAIMLRRWLRVTHGDLAAALRGYGCGFRGIESGCRRYDERVLSIRRRLRSASFL